MSSPYRAFLMDGEGGRYIELKEPLGGPLPRVLRGAVEIRSALPQDRPDALRDHRPASRPAEG